MWKYKYLNGNYSVDSGICPYYWMQLHMPLAKEEFKYHLRTIPLSCVPHGSYYTDCQHFDNRRRCWKLYYIWKRIQGISTTDIYTNHDITLREDITAWLTNWKNIWHDD